MPLNTQALEAGMRSWARDHPSMQALEAAMRVLYRRGRAQARTAADIGEVALLAVVRDHERHMTGVIGRLDESIARLLDDLDTLRSGGSLQGRTAGLQVKDLTVIAVALDELATFEAHVKDWLEKGGENARTQLRDVLEYTHNVPRSLAPVGAAAWGATPPRLRPGVPATVVTAADELFYALKETPPTRITGRPGAPPSGRQLVGGQPARVRRAVAELVAAAGGSPAEAVRRVLSAGTGPDETRMAIAVLVGSRRLSPGARASRGGPQATAFAFQELLTGSPAEWTGRLQEPIRGYETIGIDGIVEGRVRDAKWTAVAADQSGHLVAGGGRPPDPDRFPDLTEALHGSREVSISELIHADSKIGISVAAEMERQLEYAIQNGLRGIEWVCSSRDLAETFERILVQDLPARYGELGKFSFTGGG